MLQTCGERCRKMCSRLRRPAVNAFAHELVVECADAIGRVDGPKKIGEAGITGNNHAVAAFLPQEKFQQPLGIAVIQSDIRAFVRKDGG